MTSPGHSLGAHDHRLGFRSQLDKQEQALAELGGLHVVGVAAKAGILPCGVDGILTRMAKSAEPRHVSVRDALGGERRVQCVAVELWIVARFRDGPDVGQLFDSVSLQKIHELFDRVV